METQSKFLNKEYLETRLRDFSAFKKHELTFRIHESDRTFSKTLYIEFWAVDGEKHYKQKTLRISDHLLADCPHIQFIIEPQDCLTKKKKQKFVRVIEDVISLSKHKSLYHKLENLKSSPTEFI